MKEELKQVLSDIADLENRLNILKNREKALRSKLEAPVELIGKTIKITEYCYTYYIKVKNISKSKVPNDFLLEGPAIDVSDSSNGIHYCLYTKHVLSFNPEDTYEIINENEYNAVLESALNFFK